MRTIIIGLLIAASATAQATTVYFINGKQVSKAEALLTSLKDPSTRVLEVKVNYVRANQEKATLRKASDAPISAIPR